MRERESDSSSRTATAEVLSVYRAEDLKPGDMRAFDVWDTRITVANVAGTFYAFGDTCTHMGCSLAKGDLEGTTVTCPCHGSKFDARNGAVLHGPAQEPVEIYKSRVESGSLEIEG
jgi:nitrite reductase/ring-hydroxylating ferredoxin subunit